MTKKIRDTADWHDGVELSSAQFASAGGDVSYFVNAGGVAYYTTYGRRRMAFVPVRIGQAYERARSVHAAGGQDVELRIVQEIAAALGVSLSAWRASVERRVGDRGQIQGAGSGVASEAARGTATEPAPASDPGGGENRDADHG